MNIAPNNLVVPQVKRLRAMQMLEMRVSGKKIVDIAKHFNCSDDTVARTLDWAAREGLIQDAEEKILQGLVPAAIAVYEKALKEGDTFVAKDILGHLAKISDRVAQRQEHVEELSLAAYLRTRRERLDDAAGTQAAGEIGPPDITVEAISVDDAPAKASPVKDSGKRRVSGAASKHGPAAGGD